MTSRDHRGEDGDALRGFLLRLEFAFEGDEVAFRQFDLGRDLFLKR